MDSPEQSLPFGFSSRASRLGKTFKVGRARIFGVNFFLVAYKSFVGPFVHALGGSGFGCRFWPTCSEYTAEAFRSRSFLSACGLAVGRICRCNPWNQSAGYDPVPKVCG